MAGEWEQSSITAGNLVLAPVSRELAAGLVARDFSGITPGEGWPHEDSLDGLQMAAQGYGLAWLIILDDLAVGECGTHGPPGPGGVVEIGYGLAAPYRGRGYGRQTVRALSKWLLAQPGIAGVVAHTDPDNVPSRRSLEGAGYRLDGEVRGQCRYVLGEA